MELERSKVNTAKYFLTPNNVRSFIVITDNELLYCYCIPTKKTGPNTVTMFAGFPKIGRFF